MDNKKRDGRSQSLLFLVAALTVAGLTVFMVLRMLEQYERQALEAQKAPDRVEVVVARRDLYVGLPISEEDVVVRLLLPDFAPDGGLFGSVDEVIHQIPRERILANEVVRMERLAQKESGIGLNAIIASGRRAMTVETDTESGLAGLLLPGNYVDVIVTIRPDSEEIDAKWVTETILQGVRVLAVGDALAGKQKISSEEEGSKKKGANNSRGRASATLEVTPEEAEKLALSCSKGDISIVLRNDVDLSRGGNEGLLTTSQLLGIKEPEKIGGPAPVKKKTPTPFVMEIFGDKRSVVQYGSSGSRN